MSDLLFFVPIGLALFFAFNMGASGTSPTFAAAYGANLIRKQLIPGLFGLFVIIGALIAGQKVMSTIGGDILPSAQMSIITVSIILGASALSLLFANILKVPQSTSQSTVFALIGSALYFGDILTGKLFWEIIPVWFLLPLVAFISTLILGYTVKKLKSIKPLSDFTAIGAHPAWRITTIACSCYVAFSIGSNNVANAAGPIFSLISNESSFLGQSSGYILPWICILLVAPWFGIGASMLGPRVLRTTAKEIVEIGPSGAVMVSLITATLLLLASTIKGIPTSLVQMNAFSVIALGLLDKSRSKPTFKVTLIKLWTTWIIAPLIAFVLAYLFTFLAHHSGLL